MAIKDKSTVTVKAKKLSDVLGAMEYLEHAKPYHNDKTGETTTKITVFATEQRDRYEVTVKGDYAKQLEKAPKSIDFKGVSLVASARAVKGFGNSYDAICSLTAICDDLIIAEAKQ